MNGPGTNLAHRPIFAEGRLQPASETEPARVSPDPIAVALLYTPLIGVTFLAKFVVLVGGTEILLAVPLILAATAAGVLTGRLRADPTRLMLYLGMAAILCLQQVFSVKTFEFTSLILLLALHVSYVFRLNGAGDASVHHRRVLKLCLFMCVAGVVQYGAQYVIGTRFAYPIEHFTPASLIQHNYNALNPLRYGSPYFKANGVFLLEPSYYSQLLATGVVLELIGPRRLWSLACFGAGFVVSFSGTGLIMLAVSLVTLALVTRRFSLLLGLALAGFLVLSFGEMVGLNTIVERSKEFQQSGSSGYQRYVGPVMLMKQYLGPSLERTLFGVGSGMMMRMTPAPLFDIAETGWAKIIIEFGAVGAIAFFGFLYAVVFGARQPVVLCANLATMTLMSGILDGPPHGMILSMLLWATPFTKLDSAAPTRPPVEAKLEMPAGAPALEGDGIRRA